MITLPLIEAIFNSGATLYVFLHDRMTGYVWNTVTPGFEPWNVANWAQYAIPLTEQNSSGYYIAGRPAGTAGFITSESLYVQAGGSPVSSDAPPLQLGHTHGDNIAAISGDPLNAPTNLQGALATETQAAVISGMITTNSFPTNITNPTAAAFQGLTVRFITGAAAGMAGLIANYNPASGVITLSGNLAVAPVAGDTFIIV